MTTTLPANCVMLTPGKFCQEASPQSHETYIPCLRPAKYLVKGHDAAAYMMCEACADHNVTNRGARYVLQGEAVIIWQLPEIPVESAPAKSKLTIDAVMQGYQETKLLVEDMSKRHAEEMKPLNSRMELCKAWMLRFLNETKQESARTEHGLAFKSTVMSATVDPDGGWNKLIGHIFASAIPRALDVIENGGDEEQATLAMLSDPVLGLFNHAVNKTAVKELLDQGVSVPGVKISHITSVNVRRA